MTQKALPKILIVDDKVENLLALENVLSDLPVTILRASSGKEALSLLLRHDFVVVLLDVRMPEMSGIEAATLMRSHNSTMYTPLIFVSAQDSDELEQLKGYAVGAVDYIIKPINPEILLSKINMFLSLYIQSSELKRQQEQIRRLLEMNPDGMLVVNPINKILYANPAALAMFDNSTEQLVGSDFNFSTSSTDITEINVSNDHIVEMHKVPIDWNGESVQLIILHDITAHKRTQAQLIQLAEHDLLTDLANRRHCLDFLVKALARARRRDGFIAVLFLDLNKFKDINDILGHDVGDELLKSVAKRLNDCVREGDLAARFGGDEFALILDEISHPEDAGVIAKKILDTLAKPHILKGKATVVGCSIGIATYPLCGEEPEDLLKAADLAMFHAKSEGPSNYQFFAESMQNQLVRRLLLEDSLRQALGNNEFVLHYQPQVDTRSGQIIAMEALLRWNNAELGMIGPDEFIPIAEKTGLIVDIGEWVIRTACQQVETWLNGFSNADSIQTMFRGVAVNVSMSQLSQEDFVQRLSNILRKTNVNPDFLELELTESTMMENIEVAGSVLKSLRQQGHNIAVDDFGTGYSSLSYLQHLSLNALKIDQSFVAKISKDIHSEVIIKTIIAMAHSLNMRVIAEGVETEEQVTFLRKNQCDVMQGYYFARPLPAEKATLLLQDKENRESHTVSANKLRIAG